MIEFSTSSREKRQPESKDRKRIGRQDWGYTNHYRRMMMQRLPPKDNEEEETQ